MKTLKALLITLTGICCLVMFGALEVTIYSIAFVALGTIFLSLPAFYYWENKIK